MQIQVSADEVFEEYKRQLAELNHELTLERIKSRKLFEALQQYEAQQKQPAQNAPRSLQAPQESIPGVPAPPLLPEVYAGQAGRSEGTPV